MTVWVASRWATCRERGGLIVRGGEREREGKGGDLQGEVPQRREGVGLYLVDVLSR